MPRSALGQAHSLLRAVGGEVAQGLGQVLDTIRQNQASAGLTAVAAFAISIFFAWRLVRLHPNTRPRRSKPPGATPATAPPSSSAPASSPATQSGSGGQASSPSLGSDSSSNLRPGTSAALATSVSPLAAAVRKQLSGAQRITCHILGVLVHQDSPAQLQQGGATLIQASRDAILEVCRQADVYLMAQVDDDASEVALLSALEAGGILGPASPFNSNKLLFCSSHTGIMSFVRQLEPDLHIESSGAVVDQLKRFVKKQLHISKREDSSITPSSSNIVTASSLEEFFKPS